MYEILMVEILLFGLAFGPQARDEMLQDRLILFSIPMNGQGAPWVAD